MDIICTWSLINVLSFGIDENQTLIFLNRDKNNNKLILSKIYAPKKEVVCLEARHFKSF